MAASRWGDAAMVSSGRRLGRWGGWCGFCGVKKEASVLTLLAGVVLLGLDALRTGDVGAGLARGDAGRAACSRNGSGSAKQSAAGAALGRQLPRRRRWSHAERMLGLGREFARCGRGQARGTSAAAAGEGQRTKGLFEPGHTTCAPPRPFRGALPGPLHRETKCTRLCHRLAVPADSWHAAVACAYGSRSGSRSRSGGGGGARRRGCTGVSRLRRPRGPGRGCGLRQQRGGRRGRDSGALQPALRCRRTSGRRV